MATKTPVQLTYLMRRRADRSLEDFAAHLRGPYRAALDALAATTGASRVETFVRARTLSNECLRQSRGLVPVPYDGGITVIWPSLAAYQAGVGAPEGLAAMSRLHALERRFVDLPRSTAFLADSEAELRTAPTETVGHDRRAHA